METTLLFLILETYALIAGFLIYAALKPVWKQLPIAWMVILSPFALFYLADVSCRCTIGTLLFWELPYWRNPTITYMCDSHVLDADGASYKDYKRHISRMMCKTLNLIQPGHCKCMDQIGEIK
jgi:hypothetical protein